MIILSKKYVSSVTKGSIYGNGDAIVENIVTDSRKLFQGAFFWTIAGSRTHGANFLEEAFKKGLVGAVIPNAYRDIYLKNLNHYHNTTWVLCVDDTLDALHVLAEAWRNKFSIPIIGITGTVGKTTTKNMMGEFFKGIEGHYPLITERSENGLVGLPLTILKLRDFHTVAILEMGISMCGEMEKLSYIAKPTISVITFLGDAHLQGYNSKKEILITEKLTILKHAQYYKNNKKIAIINGDGIEMLPNTIDRKANHMIIYGEKNSNFYEWRGFLNKENNTFIIRHGESVVCEFTFCMMHKGFLVATIPLAIITDLFELDWDYFKKFCEHYIPQGEGRFEIISLSNSQGVIINDAYNANPDSFSVSLDALHNMYENRKKILIIGDMRELGENAVEFHERVIEKISLIKNIIKIIVFGDIFLNILRTHNSLKGFVVNGNNCQDVADEIQRICDKNSVIFIKASNGFELYKLPKVIINKRLM